MSSSSKLESGTSTELGSPDHTSTPTTQSPKQDLFIALPRLSQPAPGFPVVGGQTGSSGSTIPAIKTSASSLSLGSSMPSSAVPSASPVSSSSSSSSSTSSSTELPFPFGGAPGSSGAVPVSDIEHGENEERGMTAIGPFHPPLQNPLIPVPVGQRYVDITDYLNMPQTKAAQKLGLPTSTLSKRWKEAVCNRKWPYRAVQKLDKEITTLLYNVPTGPDAPPLPKDIEDSLGRLLRKRDDELRSVVVRI